MTDNDREHANVHYRLALKQSPAAFAVTSVGLIEATSAPYEATIEAYTEDYLVESELLATDVHLAIARGTEQRSVRGIVRSASIRTDERGSLLRLHVVPAFSMLAHVVDSRIHQDTNVPDLVVKLFKELLDPRDRRIDAGALTESYPVHEYLVQHRESYASFIQRLCDEEGIYFYFDHDAGDHEVLVLADSNQNRPSVRPSAQGRVVYTSHASHALGYETATNLHAIERWAATDVVVTGFDWSNPGAAVSRTLTERGSWGAPPMEIHQHFHHVRYYDYEDAAGGQYSANTAERQATLAAQRLDLARRRWVLETTVVTAKPGHMLSLVGAGAHDGRYLVVKVNAHGTNNPAGVGDYHNTLELVPESLPYRPPAPIPLTPRGPETAIVVGEGEEEIHTDKHGRIKVQFHWDRRSERASAWIRVVQPWAGNGWGTVFIPRVGMEVLVQFLGGDPDRPVVTGCLYNGNNRQPYPLPDDKTRSTVKTRSSPDSEGGNELRFEDKAGSEQVYLHAERNFDEVVKSEHSTSVGGSQTITIDKERVTHVKENDSLTVDGRQEITVSGERLLKVGSTQSTEVAEDEVHDVGRELVLKAADKITLKCGDSTLVMKPDLIVLQCKDGQLTIRDKFFALSTGGAILAAEEDRGRLGLGVFGLAATDTIRIEAQSALALKVASTELALDTAKAELKADTAIVEDNGGARVRLEGGAASIDASGDLVAHASEIRLNS
jgi:type VI secretion system secreted protein VgrG